MMNRRQMIAATGATLLLPATPAHAADLGGDIAILRQALTLHPGLYRYASPRVVEARLATLETAFVAAPDLDTRYLLLSRFLATIKCGHSYCNFFNQKRTVAAALFDRPTRLPFHFRWIEGRMIVTAFGGDALPRVTEVVRINGIAARDMLARLMPYARADGGNDGKRVSLLEVRGDATIEYFDVFHGLVFGAPDGGIHRLDVRLPDGTKATRTAPAIGLSARRAQMPPLAATKDGPIWDWTVRPDGVVVLTMPSWALYNSKWDRRAWLTARLDSLGDAKGLVIDLRDNEGGNDCGSMILARLIARRIARDSGERRIRYRTTPASLDAHLDTWDDSFRTWGVKATALPGGFFRLPPIDGVDWIDPVAPRLMLPVAALVGPVNSSATYQFASLCKGSGAVRLFGQETGGNRRGTIGGGFFFVRLPASGIEFDLPLIGYFPDGPRPDGGVLPDVALAPSVADIAAARDPVLAAAAAWCRTG